MTALHHKATMTGTFLLDPWKYIHPLWAGTTNSCTTSSSHYFCKPSSPDQSGNLSFWVCFCCCCLSPGTLPCTMRSMEYNSCRCVCQRGGFASSCVCSVGVVPFPISPVKILSIWSKQLQLPAVQCQLNNKGHVIYNRSAPSSVPLPPSSRRSSTERCSHSPQHHSPDVRSPWHYRPVYWPRWR